MPNASRGNKREIFRQISDNANDRIQGKRHVSAQYVQNLWWKMKQIYLERMTDPQVDFPEFERTRNALKRHGNEYLTSKAPPESDLPDDVNLNSKLNEKKTKKTKNRGRWARKPVPESSPEDPGAERTLASSSDELEIGKADLEQQRLDLALREAEYQHTERLEELEMMKRAQEQRDRFDMVDRRTAFALKCFEKRMDLAAIESIFAVVFDKQ